MLKFNLIIEERGSILVYTLELIRKRRSLLIGFIELIVTLSSVIY